MLRNVNDSSPDTVYTEAARAGTFLPNFPLRMSTVLVTGLMKEREKVRVGQLH